MDFRFQSLLGFILLAPIMVFLPETCRSLVENGSLLPPKLNHTPFSYVHEARMKRENQYELSEIHIRLAREREKGCYNPTASLQIIFS
jgi:hypothetical protein